MSHRSRAREGAQGAEKGSLPLLSTGTRGPSGLSLAPGALSQPFVEGGDLFLGHLFPSIPAGGPSAPALPDLKTNSDRRGLLAPLDPSQTSLACTLIPMMRTPAPTFPGPSGKSGSEGGVGVPSPGNTANFFVCVSNQCLKDATFNYDRVQCTLRLFVVNGSQTQFIH